MLSYLKLQSSKRYQGMNFRNSLLANNFTMFFCFLSFFTANGQQSRTSSGSSAINSKYVAGLLPVPQKVAVSSKTFSLDDNWGVEDNRTTETNAAFESLFDGLKEKRINFKIYSKNIVNTSSLPAIRLIVKSGSVQIGASTDTNRIELEKQAYKLNLTDKQITVTANAPQGLYYGVQTFLQLLRPQKENLSLPEGEIVDWPDLNVRMIYWDDAHHLEKMTALKRIIKQAAYFKINAFSIKLEGHFQFKSAPAIVEPYALSAKEYQELTDYAKFHFVELVPYLDAPAHVAFILKHREYAHLRAFPNSNYEFSVMNPQTDSLLLKLFGELIEANKGGNYLVFSTDEAYYVGKADDDRKQAEAMGGRSKLLAHFTRRIADELNKKERKVSFWGEYPLEPEDIPLLPSHLINGVYDSSTASKYKANKMRQYIYTYTEGEEPLFPSYYPMSSGDTVADAGNDRRTGRVEGMLKTISSAVSQQKSDFMGVFIAGWADAGLHPETFWLGYATGAAAGWNHRGVTSKDLEERFYTSYYGYSSIKMDTIYRLLSRQAQFYDDSWEWVPSTLRTPIFGNHAEIYKTPKPARDQTLPMLALPSNDFAVKSDWSKLNRQRLQSVQKFLEENYELTDLLHKNIRSAEYQNYSLEVMLSVAMLCRQNLTMLLHLQHMDSLMKLAAKVAPRDAGVATSLMDEVLNEAEVIKVQRDEMLKSVTTVWYKEWQPRVEEANGRKFLHKVDDVKDHRPDRTIDMTYLIYRELHYPLGKWAKDLQKVRNNFASKNNLPIRNKQLQWEDVNE
ncbi:glycoside hydrolase family 20 zincin-like fold domain-containing protein [Segetibacter koreensis]|uniref:glycoside hydrolase family 20 zincin-like fold domain-containing protein n=1 Tax=Segetibacter koreensis TaxID=398037 RepID=UPI0012FB614D|nr:glycoside hydrolase family 20 zincin-like fold domain-containing protein [Segetibacter koreensis]